jgi:hypothetical protein
MMRRSCIYYQQEQPKRLPQFLLMPVFPELLFAFVRRDLVALPFSTARHLASPLSRGLWHRTPWKNLDAIMGEERRRVKGSNL